MWHEGIIIYGIDADLESRPPTEVHETQMSSAAFQHEKDETFKNSFSLIKTTGREQLIQNNLCKTHTTDQAQCVFERASVCV